MILVTGANGQIGSSLKKVESKFDFDISFLNKSEFNINSHRDLQTLENKTNIKYLINCAAYTAVDQAEFNREDAFAINSDGLKKLAYTCNKNNICLINISSDYVYDGYKNSLYNENDPANPISLYGQSKLQGDKYIIESCKKYIILRTSWVYSEFNKNFLKSILELILKKKEISVVDDQVGSPTYSADIAFAILSIIKKIEQSENFQNFGLYNYSSEEKISWFEFAKLISEEAFLLKITNKLININRIKTSSLKQAAKRPRFSSLSSKKISDIFHVKASSLEEGIKSSLKALKER